MTWKKKKKKTIGSDQDELVKDLPTVKLVFSLGLKYSEWMNSETYFKLVRSGIFYREFGVSLLVRLHYHHGRCINLVESMKRISRNSPYVPRWGSWSRKYLKILFSVYWLSTPSRGMDDQYLFGWPIISLDILLSCLWCTFLFSPFSRLPWTSLVLDDSCGQRLLVMDHYQS